MKLCDRCGEALPQDAVFCPICGRAAADAVPAAPVPDEVAPAPDEVAAAPAADSAESAAPPAEDDAPPAAPGTDAAASPAAPLPSGAITFAEPPAAPPPPAGPAIDSPYARRPGPKYSRVQPQQSDGGLTTAQYFWTLVLFAVPVVGLGFMLYWSFGRTTSPARRRLARASLMKAGIGLVGLAAALAVAGTLLYHAAQSWLGYYQDYYYDYYGDWYGYYEDYDDPYGYGDGYGDPYGGFGGSEGWFDQFFGSDEPERIY